MKILLADDSELVREALARLIKIRLPDAQLAHAANGQHLVDRAASWQPDVIVLDIQMPGLSGMQALSHMRECAPAAFIVVLTNHATPQHMRACRAAGAHAFFDKLTGIQPFLDELDRYHSEKDARDATHITSAPATLFLPAGPPRSGRP